MDGFFKTNICGNIRTNISRRIRTQHLCGEYPSFFIYLFLGRNERFHSMIRFISFFFIINIARMLVYDPFM
jgi:hypothetical protein